jgi:hypothetical protein
MEVTTKISKVFTASGEKNGKPWTRWDVKDDSDTKYVTFKEGDGKKAEAARGKTVKLTFTQNVDGTYVNNTLEDIQVIESEVVKAVETAQAAQAETTAPPRSYEDERQLRIMRQSALQRAIDTAATAGEITDPIELFKLADTYLLYFEAGSAAFADEVPF